MIKDEKLIGCVNIYRQEVQPIHRQADRPSAEFCELRPSSPSRTLGCSTSCANCCSSRPRQAEVLKVVSSSPRELKPVFDAMLGNAVRICEAKFGLMFRFEGDVVYAVAALNIPPALEEICS